MHDTKSDSSPKIESPASRKNGSRGRVEITADLCKGCLLCIEACPPEVLLSTTSLNRLGYHPVTYTGDGCTGCGICFYVCPEPGALRVLKRVSDPHN